MATAVVGMYQDDELVPPPIVEGRVVQQEGPATAQYTDQSIQLHGRTPEDQACEAHMEALVLSLTDVLFRMYSESKQFGLDPRGWAFTVGSVENEETFTHCTILGQLTEYLKCTGQRHSYLAEGALNKFKTHQGKRTSFSFYNCIV